jgi:signal transduction histidine kinase
MRVTLADQLADPDVLPETVGRNAYRVIQEGLTNARKHAPQTPVAISLSGAPGGELRLEVRNPLRVGTNGSRPPTSGLGLVGLAERAALSGGRLEHESTADRHFVLRAWLPWPA